MNFSIFTVSGKKMLCQFPKNIENPPGKNSKNSAIKSISEKVT